MKKQVLYNNILLQTVIPAFLGGFAIFFISFLMNWTISNAILLTSLGSSAVILSEFPELRIAKLRLVISAYLISMFMGYLFSFVSFLPLGAGLGIFFTIVLMIMSDNVHPPAGGAVLAFIFNYRNFFDIFFNLLSLIFLLVILKFIIYFYKKELNIKRFHHEFMR